MKKQKNFLILRKVLSKLSISLIYEEKMKKQPNKLDEKALNLLRGLLKMLMVKGEKSAEKGVYEELNN